MADIQDTDLFLVNRNNTTRTVPASNLMADILDTDLMLINRSGQSFKVTCADVKDQLGGGGLEPRPEDITASPDFQGGTGTDVDPFILAPKTLRPAGATTSSDEFITIAVPEAEPGTSVVWTDNSTGTGDRFAQPSGVVDADGNWSGRLVYNDTPNTTTDQDYVGKLQIGIVHFQWTIAQKVSSLEPPVIDSFTLTEASEGGNRFTDQEFNAALTMTSDGPPLATKTFDAKVEGTILEPTVTSTISSVDTNVTNIGDSWSKKYEQSYSSKMGTIMGGQSYAWTRRGDKVWRVDLVLNNGANKASGTTGLAFWCRKNGTELVLSEGNKSFKYSSNAGEAWANINNNSATPFESVDVVGYVNNVWIAQKGDELWYSGSAQTNSWTYLSKPGGWPNFTSRYAYHCDEEVFASGGKTQTDDGYIAHTTNGTSWLFNSFTVPGQSNSSVDFCCVPLNGPVYIRTRSNVYAKFPSRNGISSSNCTIWTAPTSGQIMQMYAKGNTVVAQFSNGEIWKSSDAAENWEQMEVPAGITEAGDPTFNGYKYNTGLIFNDGLYFAFQDGIIKTGVTGTALTFSDTTGLDNLVAGDTLTQSNGAASGVIKSISGTLVPLSSTTGTWTPGQTANGPDKPVANTTKYLEFDSSGNVSDLLDAPQSPPYTTTDADPTLTLKFPATFPSGNTPDDELTEGTTLTVSVDVTNASGSDDAEASVQPEGVPSSTAGIFGTKLYNGTGSTQVINSGVNTAPAYGGGLIWIKNLAAASHNLFDTERPYREHLKTDSTDGSEDNGSGVTVFKTTGFTLEGGSVMCNQNTNNYVSWSFANAPGYFQSIGYNGTGGAFAEQSHDLGTVPGAIICKKLDGTGNWAVYHRSLPIDANGTETMSMFLNNNGGVGGYGFLADHPRQTAEVFTFNQGNTNNWNEIGKSYVAYLFADTPGLIKCDTYPGTGNEQTIPTYFDPAWVLIKAIDDNADWFIFDDVREASNAAFADLDIAPQNVSTGYLETGGFRLTSSSSSSVNKNGKQYMYIAIAKPAAFRSMTESEFAESTTKFATYNNRRDVHQGELAMAERSSLIDQLEAQGMSAADIEALLGPS